MEFAPLEPKSVKRPEQPLVPKALPYQPSEDGMYRGYGASYGKGYAFLDPEAKVKPTSAPSPSSTSAAPLWIEPGSEALNYRGYGAEYGKGFAFLDPTVQPNLPQPEPAQPASAQTPAPGIKVASASINSMPGILAQPQKPTISISDPPVKMAQATVTAPPRNPPRLQDPLLRPPIFSKPGAPSSQPGGSQPLNRSPVGDPTTGDPITDFAGGVKAREATVGSVQQSFGNRLPKTALGMPSGFLETVNGQWNSITQRKTFTGTGAQVPDPNYPPTAAQTLQVWNAAWAAWAKDPAQLPPEGQKAYARDYQNYLQVQKTLQEQAAAETWAGQALTSLKTPKAPKLSKPKTSKAKATPPPVHQPTTAELQQQLDRLKAQNDALSAKIKAQEQRKEAANAKVKASLEAQQRQIEREKQELQAKLQRIENQAQTEKANIQINLINSKINANRQAAVSTIQIYLDSMSPEQRQQVTNQATELYRQNNNGKPYNLKDLNDPQNDPQSFLNYISLVRGQSGVANVPVVRKPQGLPKPAQKQGDKKLPTLPIQPKKSDGQQGSFLPQPLPDVKPKSEGETAQEDPSQSQPVTNKVKNPPTNKQGQSQNIKSQKKGKKKTSSDYRKNFEDSNGPIPEGHQVHHLATQASSKKSELAQKWKKLGIADVHDPENLEALPQTKEAYDKSTVKIQHSGSHPKWNTHVDSVLEETEKDLKRQYGSLDKVPADVMKQTKDKVMKDLREDLLDKDLGIERGWIKRTKNGMDKLSQSEALSQIG